MFVEIRPYENKALSVNFNAQGEDFSKVLQAIKKVPGRAWLPDKRFWLIPADRNSCDILLNNLYYNGICMADSGFTPKNHTSNYADALNTETIGENDSPASTYLKSILQKLDEVIAAKHYSKRTKEAYSYWISRFISENKDKNLKALSDDEINSFVSRLAVKEKAAASSQNQALAAILFLYKNILGLTINTPENIVRAKKPKKLPAVMSREETAKIFSILPDNDYSLCIRLLYGTGMRLMEALRLRGQDIDFDKNEITVHDGKGAKDHKTMLPVSLKFPLIPDNSKAQALYMVFENTIGTGPKVISSLSKGLSAHTNYKIEQKLCHRWKDVNSHITNYHLPVVSLRSGWYGDWGFHYRLIIGTQKETKKEYHKFSWWWGHW
ncbi:phage integrase N-terminal SAM-like domain-containing protein [Treponema sp. OMZ 788]|uniref:phage integrase N-terminal SAM-like domain-containing protein n=1 Tax=Treponema sp. OMZ 788 TaxID=2563664 RepID=UPI0020A515F7|nr:phage integrase N-terminal SAM-like domain-containing protein [Treponema sp. OMZ 788]